MLQEAITTEAIQTKGARAIPLNRRRHYQSSKPSASFAFGVLLALLSFGFDVRAQVTAGTVNFSMTVPGLLSTRVYMPENSYPFWQKFGNTAEQIPAGTQTYSGALVNGSSSNFVAQLCAAPGANRPESDLYGFGGVLFPFRTGSEAGTVQGGTVTLPNVPADCPVATVQVRVWEAVRDNQFLLWQQVLSTGSGRVIGKSLPFNVEAIGGGTNPPPNLLNLRSFSLIYPALDHPVPPLIYVQPQHQSVPVGGNATFSVEAACPATLYYTWRFNGTNLVSEFDDPYTHEFAFPPPIVARGIISMSRSHDFFLAFPRTNVMQLTNVQPSQAGVYSMAVNNMSGGPPWEPVFAISSNAVLTVGNPGTLSVVRDQLPQIVLNWDGVFFLQSATNVGGPFTDLPGPVVFGPYTNTDSSSPRFFRLRN